MKSLNFELNNMLLGIVQELKTGGFSIPKFSYADQS